MIFLKQNWRIAALGVLILVIALFTREWVKSATSPEGATAAQELHAQAYELIQQKDYAGALEKARAAIEIDPDYIDAYVDQGIALSLLGKCAEGSASLYHASTLDPSDEDVSAIFGSMLNDCKSSEATQKQVVWKGKIFAYMTYGRHLFENIGSDSEYKYIIAEWDEIEMEKVKYTDIVEITGTTDGSCYWEDIENTDYRGCIPWLDASSIKKVGTDNNAKLPAMTCLASGICMPNE